MRTQIIKSLKAQAEGQIEVHKTNVEVYLKFPVGVGEHSDILETISKELAQIAELEDQLFVLEKHFNA